MTKEEIKKRVDAVLRDVLQASQDDFVDKIWKFDAEWQSNGRYRSGGMIHALQRLGEEEIRTRAATIEKAWRDALSAYSDSSNFLTDELLAQHAESTLRQSAGQIDVMVQAAMPKTGVDSPITLHEQLSRSVQSLAASLAIHLAEIKRDNAIAQEHDLARLPSKPSQGSSKIGVFISHSHQDEELVKRLIALLRSALDLDPSQIRATSVDGFRLPGGANTDEQLRIEVQEATVLIGVISNASLRSAYVTFELGARWGSAKPMVPLLAGDVGPESLAGPLRGISALSCRSSAQVDQLVKETAAHLNLPFESLADYQRYVDEIVELSNQPTLGPAGQRSDSFVVSARRHVPSLSEAAKELLLGASSDQHGVVMKFRTASGLHVKANNRDFVADRDPRTEAHWQGALSELVRDGLLEDRSGKGEVFGVTNSGYKKADEVRAETSNLNDRVDG